MITYQIQDSIAEVGFNDPARRNALGVSMFDALDETLGRVAADTDLRVLLLYGHGPAFSAGFDLPAAIDDPPLLEQFILRLSDTLSTIRQLGIPVIVAAHGAAIAGGCALLSAADFTIAAPRTRIGYPVHPLGISPAVSMPTLQSKIGCGPARRLQLGGELLDAAEAQRIGLVGQVAESTETLLDEARTLAKQLVSNAPYAMAVTKAWINELDGSLDAARFSGPAIDTAKAATGEEAVRMLAAFWANRR